MGTTYYVGPRYEVLVPAVILPPAPTDLTACYESMGGPNVCNHLAWSGSSGVTGSPAVSFNIYRSSSSPVPIDAGHLVTSGITETNYTDCGRSPLANGLAVWCNQTTRDPSNEAQASTPVLRGAVRLCYGRDLTGARCLNPDPLPPPSWRRHARFTCWLFHVLSSDS